MYARQLKQTNPFKYSSALDMPSIVWAKGYHYIDLQNKLQTSPRTHNALLDCLDDLKILEYAYFGPTSP